MFIIIDVEHQDTMLCSNQHLVKNLKDLCRHFINHRLLSGLLHLQLPLYWHNQHLVKNLKDLRWHFINHRLLSGLLHLQLPLYWHLANNSSGILNYLVNIHYQVQCPFSPPSSSTPPPPPASSPSVKWPPPPPPPSAPDQKLPSPSAPTPPIRGHCGQQSPNPHMLSPSPLTPDAKQTDKNYCIIC